MLRSATFRIYLEFGYKFWLLGQFMVLVVADFWVIVQLEPVIICDLSLVQKRANVSLSQALGTQTNLQFRGSNQGGTRHHSSSTCISREIPIYIYIFHPHLMTRIHACMFFDFCAAVIASEFVQRFCTINRWFYMLTIRTTTSRHICSQWKRLEVCGYSKIWHLVNVIDGTSLIAHLVSQETRNGVEKHVRAKPLISLYWRSLVPLHQLFYLTCTIQHNHLYPKKIEFCLSRTNTQEIT